MAKTFSQYTSNGVICFNADCLQEKDATYFKLTSGCAHSRGTLHQTNFLTSNKIQTTPLTVHTTSNIEHQVGTTCSRRRLARLVRLWHSSLKCSRLYHVCWLMWHRYYYRVHNSGCTNKCLLWIDHVAYMRMFWLWYPQCMFVYDFRIKKSVFHIYNILLIFSLRNRIQNNFDKGQLFDISLKNRHTFVIGIPSPISPNLCS